MMRRILTAALGLGIVLAGATSASAASIKRTSGKVTATLNYTNDRAPYGGYVTATGLDLVVQTRGRPVNRITGKGLHFRAPGNVIQPRTALVVRDITGDGDPEILISTFTGGAHCCFETRVVRWMPKAGRYVVSKHDWSGAAPKIQLLNRDRVPEFVGYDMRFAYLLDASYADSMFPPRVWNYRNGRFVEVTKRFPAVSVRGMNRAWAAYQRLRTRQTTARGNPLAAYLAAASNAGPAHRRAAWNRAIAAERNNPSMIDRVRWELRRLGYPNS